MTIENNDSTAAAATEAAKVKTVLDDMDARRIFKDTESATAYIEACQKDFADFASYPVVTVGFTEDGDFDPEVYTDQMEIAVGVLSKRGEGKNSTTVSCITIYPSPTLEAVTSTEIGTAWLRGILAKEISHVAVRGLRKAETPSEMAEAAEAMPTTVEAYTSSSRESTGGMLETYNNLWQLIKKAMGKRSKQFAIANLSKKELRKSMESASYAASVYPQLESRKNKAGEDESYFELAAKFGAVLAKQEGMDPAIFDKMLTTRNEKEIAIADDEDDFDFEKMASELAAKAEGEQASEQAEATSDESGEELAAE